MRDQIIRAREVLLELTGAGEGAPPLVDGQPAPSLADQLYSHWFHAIEGGSRDYPTAAAYRAASLDPRRFESGWRVYAVASGAPGTIVAERARDDVPAAGERLWLAPPDYIPVGGSQLRLQKGAALRVDPIVTGFADGFWHVWSPRWRREGAPDRLQRLYVTVREGCEEDFAAALLTVAPTAEHWYAKLLCGHHPAGRRDPAVLYLPFESDASAGWPATLFESTASLRDGVLPPMTKYVAHGVGWARDPAGDVSFGQELCARLCSAFETFGGGDDAWVDAASAALVGSVGLSAGEPVAKDVPTNPYERSEGAACRDT